MRTVTEIAMKLPGVQQLIAQEVLREWATEIIQAAAEKAYEWQDHPEELVHQILKLNNHI